MELSRPLLVLPLLTVGLLIGTFFGQTHGVLAQGVTLTAAERTLAQEQFAEGVRASGSEHWEVARAAFHQVYELTERPQVLINLAAAESELGLLVSAAGHYRRFLRTASAGALEPHREAVESALAEVQSRIARVQIDLEGGIRRGEQMHLDGEPLRSAVLGSRLPVDPGPHLLELYANGTVIARTQFHAEEGRQARTELARPSAGLEEPRAELSEDALVTVDEDGGTVFASPWFWLATVAVLAAAGAAVYFFVLAPDPESPAGTTGNASPGQWVSSGGGFVGTVSPGQWTSP